MIGKSGLKAALAGFLACMEEALSFQKEINADLKADLDQVSTRFQKFTKQLSGSQDVAPLREMKTSIQIGHPSYEFTIISEGYWSEFVESFLEDLEGDDDF